MQNMLPWSCPKVVLYISIRWTKSYWRMHHVHSVQGSKIVGLWLQSMYARLGFSPNATWIFQEQGQNSPDQFQSITDKNLMTSAMSSESLRARMWMGHQTGDTKYQSWLPFCSIIGGDDLWLGSHKSAGRNHLQRKMHDEYKDQDILPKESAI